MSAAATAHWRVPALMLHLGTSGWGGLDLREFHGVRAALEGLAKIVDHRSGEGRATVWQVAKAAGYGERWTRSCLADLEAAGAIVWTRGGVVRGKPTPSHFRIVKQWLVDRARETRPTIEAIRARRREATARRVSGLRFVMPGARFRRSAHAAGSAYPPPLRGSTSGDAPPVEVLEPAQSAGECAHGMPARARTKTGLPACPMCRHQGAHQ